MEELKSDEQEPVKMSEEERKELIWEINHEKITEAMRYLQRKQIKSTVSNIAQLSRLSRQTVYAHFKDGAPAKLHTTISRNNWFVMEEIMEHICRKACTGDVRAARLYLIMTGALKQNESTITNNVSASNNNAIMVNGHAFTEQMVKNLSEENLAQLEEFVKSAEQNVQPTPQIKDKE